MPDPPTGPLASRLRPLDCPLLHLRVEGIQGKNSKSKKRRTSLAECELGSRGKPFETAMLPFDRGLLHVPRPVPEPMQAQSIGDLLPRTGGYQVLLLVEVDIFFSGGTPK